MDGWNHRVRKTPVSRSTTKLHSAISPSMKDQWSGKTLRRFLRAAVARPSRSSAHEATRAVRPGGATTAACLPFVLATVMTTSLRAPCCPR